MESQGCIRHVEAECGGSPRQLPPRCSFSETVELLFQTSQLQASSRHFLRLCSADLGRTHPPLPAALLAPLGSQGFAERRSSSFSQKGWGTELRSFSDGAVGSRQRGSSCPVSALMSGGVAKVMSGNGTACWCYLLSAFVPEANP